jgi:hypothetical protein
MAHTGLGSLDVRLAGTRWVGASPPREDELVGGEAAPGKRHLRPAWSARYADRGATGISLPSAVCAVEEFVRKRTIGLGLFYGVGVDSSEKTVSAREVTT